MLGRVALRVGAAVAASMAVAPAAQAAEVVEFFDFFFSDNLGVPAENFNGFVQWNVTGGSVDLVGGVGPGVFGAPPEQPLGRYVDLGGSTGDPGRFETRLAYPTLTSLIPGATYNLTFDYRSTGGDLNTATAFVGGREFTVSTASTSFLRFSQDFMPITDVATRIAFQGAEADTDDSGIGIDGILFSLKLLPGGVDPGGSGVPAVPEPSTWAMLLAGFGAVGVAMRRRRRAGGATFARNGGTAAGAGST